MSAATYRQSLEKALQCIQASPGITVRQLAIKTGLPIPPANRDCRDNRTAERIVKDLEKRGDIYRQRDRFASNHEPFKLYPAGYVEPDKRPLFQPAHHCPCTTFTVPLDQLSQYTQKPAMGRPRQNYEQIVASILQAIEELELQARSFTQQEVLDAAGIRMRNWLGRHPEVHQQVKAAVAASRNHPLPDPVKELEAIAEVSMQDPKIPELEQKVRELETRNRELRSQLQTARINNPFDLLQAQRSHWQSEADRLRQEIDQMQSKLSRTEENLEACDRLLENSRETAPC